MAWLSKLGHRPDLSDLQADLAIPARGIAFVVFTIVVVVGTKQLRGIIDVGAERVDVAFLLTISPAFLSALRNNSSISLSILVATVSE